MRDHDGNHVTAEDVLTPAELADYKGWITLPPEPRMPAEEAAALRARLIELIANRCNECDHPADPENAAPSCGAHILHIECAGWFRCRECVAVQREAGFVPC